MIGYDVGFDGGSDTGFGTEMDYINDLWVRDQFVPPDQVTWRPGVHTVWSLSDEACRGRKLMRPNGRVWEAAVIKSRSLCTLLSDRVGSMDLESKHSPR
ncbi:UNVERIFIED_CONTAM: hypothetical protein FKN15_064587 [Acipenser sinensis]